MFIKSVITLLAGTPKSFHLLFMWGIFCTASSSTWAQLSSPTQNDSSWYDYEYLYYKPFPCGCDPTRFSENKQVGSTPPKMFMESPYQFKSNEPIVMPDSLVDKILEPRHWPFRKPEPDVEIDTLPSI